MPTKKTSTKKKSEEKKEKKEKKPEKKKKPIPKKKKTQPHENCLMIENLVEVKKKVKKLMAEKVRNPGVVQDEDAGLVFIDGEPHMVVDDVYVHNNEAQVILQTRKVVREYLKLQDLIKKNKEKK